MAVKKETEKKAIVYHRDHLPKDADMKNISYTWNWAHVTDTVALDKRKKELAEAPANDAGNDAAATTEVTA